MVPLLFVHSIPGFTPPPSWLDFLGWQVSFGDDEVWMKGGGLLDLTFKCHESFAADTGGKAVCVSLFQHSLHVPSTSKHRLLLLQCSPRSNMQRIKRIQQPKCQWMNISFYCLWLYDLNKWIFYLSFFFFLKLHFMKAPSPVWFKFRLNVFSSVVTVTLFIYTAIHNLISF